MKKTVYLVRVTNRKTGHTKAKKLVEGYAMAKAAFPELRSNRLFQVKAIKQK